MHPVMSKPSFTHLATVALISSLVGLSGCQTFKNLTGKEDSTIQTAEKSEQAYFEQAMSEIEKGHNTRAIESLSNLRTFYPTGRYAQQALLERMYANYNLGEFEAAASDAQQFITLYPSNPQVSYAYYVRGVANMEGSSGGLRLFRLNQAERDTAYYRLAFANFQELIAKYPSSPYAPDAAQRMLFIYNQFAQSELTAARWYIEREAYVAAANRAKWVFQYYPQSESVPEAIAILAYSNAQLGLDDLANQYKTLLQINYPEWLNSQGQVRLQTKRGRSWINKLSFGKIGRAQLDGQGSSSVTGDYTGATKTQVIRQAGQLQLPQADDNADQADEQLPTSTPRRSIGIGEITPDNK